MTHTHTAHTQTLTHMHARSLALTHVCTQTHTHTHMGSKARPHTSTNLYSQSSSEIWNEGGWQGAWYPVWFPAPYEMPVALEAAFLGKGLPETVIRRSGFVPIYQYISKHNCRIPALHSNKDHQGSHLYISTLTITLLRSFFFYSPEQSVQMLSVALFSCRKNIASYLQLPPEGFKWFHFTLHKFSLVNSWSLPLPEKGRKLWSKGGRKLAP